MRRHRFILLLFTALAFGTSEMTFAQNDTSIAESHEYVSRNGKPLMLDFYRPAHPRPDSACVVYMFGGGFVEGSRQDEWTRKYCQLLAGHGYAVVAIDYRLHLREVKGDTIGLRNMQSVFRDAINIAAADCAAALAFLCGHASEWGVATNRIVLCGSSAGAIGVLQLDYCRANSMWPAAELPAGFKPAAVVAYAGGVFADGGKPSYKTPPAPTFFLHGIKDKIVNYKKFPPILCSGLYGAKKTQKVFRTNSYPHWIYRFEDVGHEVASYNLYMFEEFDAFVNKALQGCRMYYDATIKDDFIKPTKWTSMNVFDLYRK